jgi:translation initiation factor eIF-2B subunit delta
MPVPITTPAAKGDSSTQLPSQKLTKAERRELQEKQRAAKAAKQVAAAGSITQKPATTPTPKKPTAKTPDVVLKTVPVKPSKDKKDTGSVGMSDDREQRMSRGVRIFSHFGEPKHLSVSAVKGNVHPAIIRLGLLFSGFTIAGANARCIATLTAFKIVSPNHNDSFVLGLSFLFAVQVIRDYSTPANNTLSRHLVSHLSPQITHLVSARPMSVTMGNAIRQLKVEISGSDIDMPEQDVGLRQVHVPVSITDPFSV